MMWKRMKELKKDQRGLTLIELLAVVVILGIIMMIAIPAIGDVINNQRAQAHRANALMILDSAKTYYLEHPEATTAGAAAVTFAQLVPGNLEAIPNDPFTGNPYNAVAINYNNGNPTITLATAGNGRNGARSYTNATRDNVINPPAAPAGP